MARVPPGEESRRLLEKKQKHILNAVAVGLAVFVLGIIGIAIAANPRISLPSSPSKSIPLTQIERSRIKKMSDHYYLDNIQILSEYIGCGYGIKIS